MPKTYTTKTFDPKDFTDSETFNNESSNILSNFNGVLDAHSFLMKQWSVKTS
jgi:hypothetical protein